MQEKKEIKAKFENFDLVENFNLVEKFAVTNFLLNRSTTVLSNREMATVLTIAYFLVLEALTFQDCLS